MAQCRGTTKKGARCRIEVAHGHYCRYHGPQGSKKASNKATRSYVAPFRQVSPVKSGGWIYVFTLDHLVEPKPKKQRWLQMAEPTSNNVIDYHRVNEFSPKHDILIKVGFTSTTPRKRLSQWMEQCKQNFVLVDPTMLHTIVCSKKDKFDSMLHRFSAMHLGNNYRQYVMEEKGFRSRSAYSAEQDIHRILREQYGFGKLYCDGCKDRSGGVHREWFLVPRKDIREIFRLIDRVCRN